MDWYIINVIGKYSIHSEHLSAWKTPHSLLTPLLRWKDRLGDFYLRGKREVENLKVYGVPYQQEGIPSPVRQGVRFETSDPQMLELIPSLKLTFSHLKIDDGKIIFLLGYHLFRDYVIFREGSCRFFVPQLCFSRMNSQKKGNVAPKNITCLL